MRRRQKHKNRISKNRKFKKNWEDSEKTKKDLESNINLFLNFKIIIQYPH